VVVAGMMAATCLAVFLIPVLYVLVERIGGAERKRARAEAESEGAVLLPVAEESHS
jgi:hypothetical protein